MKNPQTNSFQIHLPPVLTSNLDNLLSHPDVSGCRLYNSAVSQDIPFILSKIKTHEAKSTVTDYFKLINNTFTSITPTSNAKVTQHTLLLTPKDRESIIEWMIATTNVSSLNPDVAYLATSLFDRFIAHLLLVNTKPNIQNSQSNRIKNLISLCCGDSPALAALFSRPEDYSPVLVKAIAAACLFTAVKVVHNFRPFFRDFSKWLVSSSSMLEQLTELDDTINQPAASSSSQNSIQSQVQNDNDEVEQEAGQEGIAAEAGFGAAGATGGGIVATSATSLGSGILVRLEAAILSAVNFDVAVPTSSETLSLLGSMIGSRPGSCHLRAAFAFMDMVLTIHNLNLHSDSHEVDYEEESRYLNLYASEVAAASLYLGLLSEAAEFKRELTASLRFLKTLSEDEVQCTVTCAFESQFMYSNSSLSSTMTIWPPVLANLGFEEEKVAKDACKMVSLLRVAIRNRGNLRLPYHSAAPFFDANFMENEALSSKPLFQQADDDDNNNLNKQSCEDDGEHEDACMNSQQHQADQLAEEDDIVADDEEGEEDDGEDELYFDLPSKKSQLSLLIPPLPAYTAIDCEPSTTPFSVPSPLVLPQPPEALSIWSLPKLLRSLRSSLCSNILRALERNPPPLIPPNRRILSCSTFVPKFIVNQNQQNKQTILSPLLQQRKMAILPPPIITKKAPQHFAANQPLSSCSLNEQKINHFAPFSAPNSSPPSAGFISNPPFAFPPTSANHFCMQPLMMTQQSAIRMQQNTVLLPTPAASPTFVPFPPPLFSQNNMNHNFSNNNNGVGAFNYSANNNNNFNASFSNFSQNTQLNNNLPAGNPPNPLAANISMGSTNHSINSANALIQSANALIQSTNMAISGNGANAVGGAVGAAAAGQHVPMSEGKCCMEEEEYNKGRRIRKQNSLEHILVKGLSGHPNLLVPRAVESATAQSSSSSLLSPQHPQLPSISSTTKLIFSQDAAAESSFLAKFATKIAVSHHGGSVVDNSSIHHHFQQNRAETDDDEDGYENDDERTHKRSAKGNNSSGAVSVFMPSSASSSSSSSSVSSKRHRFVLHDDASSSSYSASLTTNGAVKMAPSPACIMPFKQLFGTKGAVGGTTVAAAAAAAAAVSSRSADSTASLLRTGDNNNEGNLSDMKLHPSSGAGNMVLAGAAAGSVSTASTTRPLSTLRPISSATSIISNINGYSLVGENNHQVSPMMAPVKRTIFDLINHNNSVSTVAAAAAANKKKTLLPKQHHNHPQQSLLLATPLVFNASKAKLAPPAFSQLQPHQKLGQHNYQHNQHQNQQLERLVPESEAGPVSSCISSFSCCFSSDDEEEDLEKQQESRELHAHVHAHLHASMGNNNTNDDEEEDCDGGADDDEDMELRMVLDGAEMENKKNDKKNKNKKKGGMMTMKRINNRRGKKTGSCYSTGFELSREVSQKLLERRTRQMDGMTDTLDCAICVLCGAKGDEDQVGVMHCCYTFTCDTCHNMVVEMIQKMGSQYANLVNSACANPLCRQYSSSLILQVLYEDDDPRYLMQSRNDVDKVKHRAFSGAVRGTMQKVQSAYASRLEGLAALSCDPIERAPLLLSRLLFEIRVADQRYSALAYSQILNEKKNAAETADAHNNNGDIIMPNTQQQILKHVPCHTSSSSSSSGGSHSSSSNNNTLLSLQTNNQLPIMPIA